MSKKLHQTDTLFSGLTESNYDSIIRFVNLWKDGWNFYYIVDADLIGNYCFPKGFYFNSKKNDIRQLSDEYLADEQITLHSLFYLNNTNEKLVFFDDYYEELKAMINTAKSIAFSNSRKSTVDNNSNSRTYTNDLLQGLFNNIDDYGNIEDLPSIIQDHFSEIIASVLFRIDGLKKVKAILDKKLLIFESSDLKNELLENACNTEKGNTNSARNIRQAFEDIITSVGRNYDALWPSKDTDITVIDRVININSFIQQHGDSSSRKNLFLLALDSSIDYKAFSRIKNSESINYPLINGEKVNFFINTNEFFVYLISREYYKNGSVNFDKTIDNLKKLKKVSFYIDNEFKKTRLYLETIHNTKNTSKDSFSIISSIEYRDIFINYTKIRNSFENIGLLKSFDLFYNSIKIELNDKKFGDIKKIFDEIRGQEKGIVNDLLLTHGSVLDELSTEAKFNNTFVRGIEAIKTNPALINVSKGLNDIIESRYQCLPIFFKFSNITESQNYHDVAWEIARIILDPVLTNSKEYSLSNELVSLLHRLYKIRSNRNHPIEEKIIKVLIYLLLPDPVNDNSKSKEDDIKPLQWIENVETTISELGVYESDFLYLKCWLYRRYGNYNEAIKISNIGIKRFPTDPRFHHGDFLSKFCKYDAEYISGDKSLSVDSLSSIDEIIKEALLAHDLYPTFISEYYANNDIDLIASRIDDCFNNNLCFFYTEKAKIQLSTSKFDGVEWLSKAKRHLDKLIGYTQTQMLPEYYDTKAYYYYVASYFETANNILEKIDIAIKSVETAIELSTDWKQKGKYLKFKEMLLKRRGMI